MFAVKITILGNSGSIFTDDETYSMIQWPVFFYDSLVKPQTIYWGVPSIFRHTQISCEGGKNCIVIDT